MIRIVDSKTGERLDCKDAKDIQMNAQRVLQGRAERYAKSDVWRPREEGVMTRHGVEAITLIVMERVY